MKMVLCWQPLRKVLTRSVANKARLIAAAVAAAATAAATRGLPATTSVAALVVAPTMLVDWFGAHRPV